MKKKLVFVVLTAATPKDLFDTILPKWFGEKSNPDLNEAALETFQKFTSYFTGFQENRKNVYSAEPIPTAVPYRIVNDNFTNFYRIFLFSKPFRKNVLR